MNIVIPMAGVGRRFAEAGYATPKPLLLAHGKTLLQWSVDSLPLHLATRLVFVGLEQHRAEQHLEGIIRGLYASFDPRFHWLAEPTRGQAETVLAAACLLDPSSPLLIFNIDTAFESQGLTKKLQAAGCDGVLGAFPSSEPRFSFARVDEAGIVTEVREKIVISSNALTGLYHFASTAAFLEVAQAAIVENDRAHGEFYVAPLYNRLIARGARFVLDQCERHWILGTPVEYEAFLRQSVTRRA